jgi:uncharacterized protein
MTGETNLSLLLQNMRPERQAGEYVFCVVDTLEQAAALRPTGVFQEKEGVTVILTREQADTMSMPYSLVCAWITLTVHSSLAAVGLASAVSRALAEENISCNMVAAYYHDHLFVPFEDGARALKALSALTINNNLSQK